MHLYIEQLKYITDVTQLLNENMERIAGVSDESAGVYIHVELRESHTHRKIGEWSDEIAGDCWAFVSKEEKDG